MRRTLISLTLTGLLSGAVVQFTYDSLNRITRATYPDGTVIAYSYDGSGNRTSQVITNPSIPQASITVDKSRLMLTALAGQSSAPQVVSLMNSGGGSLQWNATPSASWLSVSPGSGMNSGTITVVGSAASLATGSYNATISIYASASNSPLMIPVSLSVNASSGNPSISSGGIVSAAGYQSALSRGSVGSVFGASLADTIASADKVPLPRSLAGVAVSVNGVNAPLWYVSAGQINFQVPFEAPLTGSVPVVVSKNGVPSQAANAPVQEYAPSVFTYQRTSGVFDPIITKSDASIVSPSNPAVPGDYLTVWGTGIGNLTSTPTSGDLTPNSPLSKAQLTPTITLGGTPVDVQFAGLTPGGVGLAQFNIHLPSSLPQASTLPLVIQFGSVSSQAVNVAVHSTGPARPDISIQVTDFVPQNPLATDDMTLWENITDTSHFSGDLVTKLYVSQTSPVAADSAQASAPATLTLKGSDGSFTWSGVALPQGLKPGTYYLAVGAMFPGNTDPQGVTLSNSVQIQILDQRPPFDLAIQLKDVSPTTVGAGDPIKVHYSVSEPSGISGTFSRSIYISNAATISTASTLVNTRTFDLVKGTLDLTSTGNSIPRSLAAGNYYIGVIVDTNGDSSPANNTSSTVPITVTAQRAPFDVGVQVVSVTPTTIGPGGTFTVTYNIKNTSQSTGIYNRWVYLATDQTISTNNQLLSTGTFSLTGGDAQFTTAAITLPSSTAPGKYYIGVIVENQGDTNAADNTSAAFAIQVGSSGTANAVTALESAGHAGTGPHNMVEDSRTDGGSPANDSGPVAENNQKPAGGGQ